MPEKINMGDMGDNTYPFPSTLNARAFKVDNDIAVKGGANVDSEEYIKRLDQDRRQSEKRIQQNLDKLESHLREDRQQMEQRITEERRLSEERMEKRFSEAMSEMCETRKEIKESRNWIIGLCLATILGIAAMVITVIVK